MILEWCTGIARKPPHKAGEHCTPPEHGRSDFGGGPGDVLVVSCFLFPALLMVFWGLVMGCRWSPGFCGYLTLSPCAGGGAGDVLALAVCLFLHCFGWGTNSRCATEGNQRTAQSGHEPMQLITGFRERGVRTLFCIGGPMKEITAPYNGSRA